MISLVTGTPGAGKSLYAISYVKAKAEKESRQVYYHGIKDVTLKDWIHLDDPQKWYAIPEGSIYLHDECQTTFRPRPMGSRVPQYESEFETHRHKGHDVFLITQHPSLLSSHVRKLVGQHFHVKRKFGTNAATIHEWSEVKQDPSKERSDSIRHDFKYPKEAFNWYKSAEIHTVKRNIPMRVYLMFLVPIFLALMAYFFFQSSFINPTDSDESTQIDVLPTQDSTKPIRRSPSQELGYIQARIPEVKGLPYTAPIYSELTTPVTAPYPAACVQSKSYGCKCFSQQGTKLDVQNVLCSQIVQNGFFVDWQHQRSTGVSRGETPAAKRLSHAIQQ